MYNKIIEDILFLPAKFHAENVTMYFLIQQTGYFEQHALIDEESIYKAIIKFPNCINEWLQWSDDKRSDKGWGFYQKENGKFVVFYYSPKSANKEFEYEDIAKACAAFVKNEIEHIGKIGEAFPHLFKKK